MKNYFAYKHLLLQFDQLFISLTSLFDLLPELKLRIGWQQTIITTPKQKNNYDCGIFVCLFIANNLNLNFLQEDIAFFRDHIVKEINAKKLISIETKSNL